MSVRARDRKGERTLLRVELVAVGTKPPSWVLEGIEQYVSRMRRECRFYIREIKTSDRNRKLSVAEHQEAEAEAILAALQPSARIVAMDSRGKNWSTEQLAQKIENWSQTTSHLQFVIGGPDGLSRAVLDRADDTWSLSALTFPHFLVRVLLSEQIYRALMVNANHPYHK